MARFANILGTVGNTPVVKVGKLAPAGVDLYVKIEAFNPLGSVKDRLALGIIEDAERRGALKPGQTVIEATSGNTGIAEPLLISCHKVLLKDRSTTSHVHAPLRLPRPTQSACDLPLSS